MSAVTKTLDELCVDTIRTLSIDAVQKANSGHPGLPLGAAPMAYVLWQRHLRHNPRDPHWPDRDRFVLSAGHGCMLLYSLLHLTGYDLSLDDLKAFRQWGSKTPGHPETHLTPGVEATTGPLGQGTANAVGMAIAERFLAARYNRPGQTIVDHRTFALVGDGDLMEGISSEAGSLAGHLKLGKLKYLYDDNHVSLDGPTSQAFTEDVLRRYEAYGWQVLRVERGNTDLEAIDAAIRAAIAEEDRPSIVAVRTTIGYGSPHKAGTSAAHGSPLGVEEVALTKKDLGWEWTEAFYEPPEALKHFRTALERGAKLEADWERRFEAWAGANPELAEEWRTARKGGLPAGWDAKLPSWKPGESLATRVASGKAINALAPQVPWLLGGDADLSESTKTKIESAGDFDGVTGQGNNIHYGVREHAMAAMANGMSWHGGVRPFVATFFCFSDYMRPSIRLAALNELPTIFVWTHDSIGLGEDGPTHQAVEQLMSLRLMPHFTIIRPGDANETVEAWRAIMEHREGAIGLVLCRQNVPVLDRSGARGDVSRGGYVLAEASGGAPKVILMATGSELQLAVAGRQKLEAEGVPTRVVSMPCWEFFDKQPRAYRDDVLPPGVRARISIEAGVTLGWQKYVGDGGGSIGVDRYGASAPGEVVLREYGFTADHVVAFARGVLKKGDS
ncbi:MAG TPA: transketolase [Thermoanaerobaculia bacterium]|nr:transketolase [Thermoanaerobaculia bacterium]